MRVLPGVAVCSAVFLLAAADANAQNRAIQDCRANVADALGINGNSVAANFGGTGENGSPVVEWEANLGGRRIPGFCETSRNGNVISTQLGRFAGGGRPGNGGGSIFPPGGGGGRAGGNGGAVLSIKVDTSGRGTFNAMGQNVRITRGWVDTTQTPSVSLSGENNFKITFSGNITGQGQNREFTMQITRSDRGNATGTATVRMNPQGNEVEYIKVDGRVGNSPFSGQFNR